MTTSVVAPQLDGDPVLLTRVRSGDAAAYAELFARHRAAALAFARSLAGANHAEDLVAEAFARVLDALQRDLGPTVSFRSYLLTSIRSLWANTVRSETRYDLVEDYATVPALDALTFSDDPEGRFDNQAVAAAYQSLSERWQAVLWYTEVEGLPHAEVALYLGIKPNAVAALSFRAREGLRQAYLAAHLCDVDDAVCRAMVDLLPAYARGGLDKRKRPTLEAHLQDCRPCTVALADLDEVNHRLGALLLPVVLGAGASQLGWPATSTDATKAGAAAALGAAKTGAMAFLASVAVVAAIVVPLLLTADDPRPGRDDAAVELGPPLPVDSRRQVTLTARRPDVVATERVTPEPAARTAAATQPHPAAQPQTPRQARPETQPQPEVPPSGNPTASPSPSPTSSWPTSSPTISSDTGIPVIDLTRIGLAGQSAARISVALSNLHRGSIVTIDVTNLAGFPVLQSQGWDCPGVLGGLPTGGLSLSSTRVVCTYTDPSAVEGLLELAALTSGSSTVTATIAPPAGVVDPDPANNTATATITP